MNGIESVISLIPGIARMDIERWIRNDWIKPSGGPQAYVFLDIDIARVRLIRELRDEMDIDEVAMPVVLSLLDQLYDLRRLLRDVPSENPIGEDFASGDGIGQ